MITPAQLSEALGTDLPADAQYLVYRSHGEDWPLELLDFEESSVATLPRYGHFFSRGALQDLYPMVLEGLDLTHDPATPNFWPDDQYGGYLRAREVRQIQALDLWEEIHEELWPVWERMNLDAVDLGAALRAFWPEGAETPDVVELHQGASAHSNLNALPGVQTIATHDDGALVFYLLRVLDES